MAAPADPRLLAADAADALGQLFVVLNKEHGVAHDAALLKLIQKMMTALSDMAEHFPGPSQKQSGPLDGPIDSMLSEGRTSNSNTGQTGQRY
jgi:hypothetical protein